MASSRQYCIYTGRKGGDRDELDLTITEHEEEASPKAGQGITLSFLRTLSLYSTLLYPLELPACLPDSCGSVPNRLHRLAACML